MIQDTYNPGQQLHQEQANQNETHSTSYNLNNAIDFKPDNYSMLRINTRGSSPTGITKTSTEYLGRYFTCKAVMKLSHFGK